jgi:hypothetical protein
VNPDPFRHSRSLTFRGLVLVVVLWLTACTPQNNRPVATAPAPPKPAATQPAPPDPQLSIPQTTVLLPSLQQVNPDAIPKSLPPSSPPPAQTDKADAVPPPKNTRRAAGAAKTDPEPPPAAAPAEEAPPRFQPILKAEEQKRLQDAIEARRHEIDDRLRTAARRRQDKSLVERIRSFVHLSEQAAQRGDFTQADALSERALILAKELQVE